MLAEEEHPQPIRWIFFWGDRKVRALTLQWPLRSPFSTDRRLFNGAAVSTAENDENVS